MKLEWLGEYRDLIEKLIRYCNAYAQVYNVEQSFHTSVQFSLSQLQVMEYILENEERRENMAAIAHRLGISPSVFSKNVKRMTEKGLLEKYRTGSNKKDIIVQVSPLGREVYTQYTHFMYDNGFGQAFRLLDQIPKEYIEIFTRMLAGTTAQETLPTPEPLIRIE